MSALADRGRHEATQRKKGTHGNTEHFEARDTDGIPGLVLLPGNNDDEDDDDGSILLFLQVR